MVEQQMELNVYFPSPTLVENTVDVLQVVEGLGVQPLATIKKIGNGDTAIKQVNVLPITCKAIVFNAVKSVILGPR